MDTNCRESEKDRNDPVPEADFVLEKLELRFAAIDRGDVEDWDSASIKAEGRAILVREHDGLAPL